MIFPEDEFFLLKIAEGGMPAIPPSGARVFATRN